MSLVKSASLDTREQRRSLSMMGDASIGEVLAYLADLDYYVIVRRCDLNFGRYCVHSHKRNEYGVDGYGDTPAKALVAMLAALERGESFLKWEYGMEN